MKIKNIDRGSVLAEDCKVADKFFARFMGLMGKTSLPQGKGLMIVPCNSIHMFFMKFPLDVVFLDRNLTVVHVIENIQPWKVSKLVTNAHSVIELPAGTVAKSRTVVGDRLEMMY